MHPFTDTVKSTGFRFLTLVAIACTICGCGEIYRYAHSGKVSWALKKELRDNNKKEVDIAQLTDFKWEELFMFGPYHPTGEVCKRLNLSQYECRTAIAEESTDDGEMLLVFRHEGKIVHSELHMRWHGDFTPVPRQPIRHNSAVFVVQNNPPEAALGAWLILRPKWEIEGGQ